MENCLPRTLSALTGRGPQRSETRGFDHSKIACKPHEHAPTGTVSGMLVPGDLAPLSAADTSDKGWCRVGRLTVAATLAGAIR